MEVSEDIVAQEPEGQTPAGSAESPSTPDPLAIGIENDPATQAVEHLAEEVGQLSELVSERLQEIAVALNPDDPDIGVLGLATDEWVALAAVGALIVAILQLAMQAQKQARETRQSTLQSRTQFFFDISRQWDSEVLAESRKVLAAVASKSHEAATHEVFSSEEVQRRQAELFGKELAVLRAEDPERYTQALKVFNFLEALGYAARRGYVPFDDLAHMFGGAIQSVVGPFLEHVRSMRSEMGQANLYENLEWLLVRIEDWSHRTTT